MQREMSIRTRGAIPCQLSGTEQFICRSGTGDVRRSSESSMISERQGAFAVIGDPAKEPVSKPSVLEQLGLTPVINAKGAASQLGGNLLSAAAQGAMIEAGQRFVPLQELQARASQTICRTTGAEAGCVASGAAACLFLAAAACMAGDDLAAMDRLPDTAGLRNEIVMHRAHRNPYDHALRATGARLVEVGYLGGPSSPGTRGWEFESAITDRTCACFFVASGVTTEVLPLAAVAEIAHRHGVPVVVDAAGVMPPADNLTRFIGEGADLVAFSGGKGIGGPAASGFLAGRRDLVLSATLQQQDMYVHPSMWSGPFGDSAPIFTADPPRQGMGRMLKVGREEIAGLISRARGVRRTRSCSRRRRVTLPSPPRSPTGSGKCKEYSSRWGTTQGPTSLSTSPATVVRRVPRRWRGACAKDHLGSSASTPGSTRASSCSRRRQFVTTRSTCSSTG